MRTVAEAGDGIIVLLLATSNLSFVREPMTRRKANLNHLRILSVILKEPNLSRAGDILGISQPTLSSVLKQLRVEFDDPLLVRSGNRMKLTAKAKSLEAPLNSIFKAIDDIWEVGSPDPKESGRNILIGSTDYGAFITAPALYNHLAEEAPGITVQFVDAAETKEMINQESEIDFYLIPDLVRYAPAFQNFKYVPLFDDEMVYMVGNHHRLAKSESPDPDEVNEEVFALFHVGMERHSIQSSKILADLHGDRKITMQVQQFSVLPNIAENTDTVVILPRRMAEKMADKHNCTILGPIMPAFEFSFCLMWDPLYQPDEVHEYLREAFRSLFR